VLNCGNVLVEVFVANHADLAVGMIWVGLGLWYLFVVLGEAISILFLVAFAVFLILNLTLLLNALKLLRAKRFLLIIHHRAESIWGAPDVERVKVVLRLHRAACEIPSDPNWSSARLLRC
jgi:hypothetical protein